MYILERTKTCSRADSTRYRSQLTIMNYSLCAVYSIFYIFFYYKQYYQHFFAVAVLLLLPFLCVYACIVVYFFLFTLAVVVVFFFIFIQSTRLFRSAVRLCFCGFRFVSLSYEHVFVEHIHTSADHHI